MPVEYAEFQFCREMGWRPRDLEDVPDHLYQLWRGFLQAEGVVSTRRSLRQKFLGNG